MLIMKAAISAVTVPNPPYPSLPPHLPPPRSPLLHSPPTVSSQEAEIIEPPLSTGVQCYETLVLPLVHALCLDPHLFAFTATVTHVFTSLDTQVGLNRAKSRKELRKETKNKTRKKETKEKQQQQTPRSACPLPSTPTTPPPGSHP